MDALEVLRQMHVEAKSAFKKIESASPTERGGLWAALQPQLEVHERIEERFVYDPVAADAGGEDPVLARWEEEHEAQVADADTVMARIDAGEPTSDTWLREVSSLAATLEEHIAHEEEDIWPRIKSLWSTEQLEAAGRAVAAAKDAVVGGATVEDAIARAEQLV